MSNQRNEFMITLREVAQIVKTSQNSLSKEEILGYFKEQNLLPEQENMVFEYLSNYTAIEEEERRKEELEEEEKLKEQEEKERLSELQSENEFPDSKVFNMYMEEISLLKKYSSDEIIEMYDKLMSGDDSAIKPLSECWLIKVLEVAKGYISPKYNIEDVIQEGNLGLFMELSSMCGEGDFDASQVSSVEERLNVAINNYMRAYISEVTGEDDSEQTVLGKATLVNEARKLLKEINNAEPTIEELAEYTKIAKEELQDILEIIGKAK